MPPFAIATLITLATLNSCFTAAVYQSLPITERRRAHWPKSTELLHLNVVRSSGLHCRVERLPLYQLLAGLTAGLGSLLACCTRTGAGGLASGY